MGARIPTSTFPTPPSLLSSNHISISSRAKTCSPHLGRDTAVDRFYIDHAYVCICGLISFWVFLACSWYSCCWGACLAAHFSGVGRVSAPKTKSKRSHEREIKPSERRSMALVPWDKGLRWGHAACSRVFRSWSFIVRWWLNFCKGGLHVLFVMMMPKDQGMRGEVGMRLVNNTSLGSGNVVYRDCRLLLEEGGHVIPEPTSSHRINLGASSWKFEASE